METIIVATGNAHKLNEIREIWSDPDLELISMKDAGVDVEIIENGTTFEENAVIKARTVAQASGHMALADDSGLVVDAMDGEPGIHSARYMGRDTSYDVKNNAIIDQVNEYCRQKEDGQETGGQAAAAGRPGSLPDGHAPHADRDCRGFRCRHHLYRTGPQHNPAAYDARELLC